MNYHYIHLKAFETFQKEYTKNYTFNNRAFKMSKITPSKDVIKCKFYNGKNLKVKSMFFRQLVKCLGFKN